MLIIIYIIKSRNCYYVTDMFCYQCEQTKSRRGCVTVGVCGKSPQVAALQDLLMYVIKGLAVHANRAINMGVYSNEECDDFVKKAMFR
jgi:hydroxylamine reductase